MVIVHEKVCVPKFVISIRSSVQSRNTSVIFKFGIFCSGSNGCGVGKVCSEFKVQVWSKFIISQDVCVVSQDWIKFISCSKVLEISKFSFESKLISGSKFCDSQLRSYTKACISSEEKT
ncbi:MAG: hypothetical protein WCG25_06885 [bacterium]